MMRAPRRRLALFASALLLAACSKEQPTPVKEAVLHVETIKTTGDDVAETVRREVVRAKADKRDVIVYVGAAWCEPCQYFHNAAAAGELDGAFPGLRLVEFDLDRDREALARAGYASKMIPLFALPREDGSGSGEQIEGSIKGPGAVAQITPRLKELLGKRR